MSQGTELVSLVTHMNNTIFHVMWFVINKNVTMLHNLWRNWPVMMEASSLQVFTSPRRKMRLMTLIKLVKLFVLWSESDPLGTTGGVFYLIPLLKNTYSRYSHLQITIGIVTVNLLLLQLVSNELLPVIYLYFMSNIAEKAKILIEWSKCWAKKKYVCLLSCQKNLGSVGQDYFFVIGKTGNSRSRFRNPIPVFHFRNFR